MNPLKARALDMRQNAIRRAKKKGLPYEEGFLSMDNLIQLQKSTTKCPYCQRQIDYTYGKHSHIPSSPSLDRIDNTKGYTKDNTEIICYRCNMLKRKSTAEEYKKIAIRLNVLETRVI